MPNAAAPTASPCSTASLAKRPARCASPAGAWIRATQRSITRGSSSPTRWPDPAATTSRERSPCRPRASSPASMRATTCSAACTRPRPTRSWLARCGSSSTSTSRSRSCSTRWVSTACATSRAAATVSGARGWSPATRNGSTCPTGATSTTWNRPSTAARNGPCSSPTASACGPTCARPSPTSFTTNGATARCWAARWSRPSSCAATAAP